MSLLVQAEQFARKKHCNMVRHNLAKQPIVEHLAEVVDLAKKNEASDEAIAAAWLHDVVEDTEATIEDIEAIFGDKVASYVDGLTDPKGFEKLELSIRKKKQAERIKTMPEAVRLIKLCDQISNVKSVLNDPPLDWTKEKCLTYTDGADLLVQECRGLSNVLDEEFIKLKKTSKVKYKTV